ncbi:gluconate 2-dehydrogenase subunit 3 family protein [Ideonella sp. YS5]|uniref:gluconate 2-dehydrogenase subunit 3 family protein n=1 Tax=Ideonella sp. YS5 TaxID=3453714 RepID=UPI003EE84449
MDRRESMQWMLAAAAAGGPAWTSAAVGPTRTRRDAHAGIGTDPDLVKTYRAGELWPLTFTAVERRCAAALCALIIPADERSPSAADLQVHVFIDEWVSAPYPRHVKDKAMIRQGLAWLDGESRRRFEHDFAGASVEQQRAICDEICWAEKAAPERAAQATFFARFRDLTGGGFYTTPAGMADLGFAGNVPLERFDGPPAEVIRLVGLA